MIFRRKKYILIFIFIKFYITNGSKILKYTNLFLGLPVINISIGNPPQFFTAILQSTISELILIDRRCSQMRNDCPRYCKTEYFGDMYCHPLCQPKKGFSDFTLCGNLPRYNSKLSNTSFNTGKEWIGQFDDSILMYGQWFNDSFQIKNEEGNEISVQNFTLVSGLRMDNRYFKLGLNYMNAILGFAPQNKVGGIPFIKQLAMEGQILEPVLSFSIRDSTIIFGGLDPENCYIDQEIRLPSISKNEWIVEVNNFKATSMKPIKKVKLLLQPSEIMMGVPKYYIDILMKKHIIWDYNENEPYLYLNCDDAPIATFELKGVKMAIDFSEFTILIKGSNNLCLLIANIIDSRYNDWPTWQLGIAFSAFQCFSLNFTDNTVGFYDYKPPRTSGTVNIKNSLIKTLPAKLFHQKV